MDAMIHERHIPVGGCSNFRDLGGYVTADGKHKTRWNRLYRSDHLGKIEHTHANLSLLCEELKIKYSVDFRGEGEKKAEPYRIPNVVTTEIPVEPGSIMATLMKMDEILEPSAVAVMVELNEIFVTQYQAQYKAFLKLVIAKGSESAKDAIVFHCTAGKDRTGYAAALILLLLGVDKETVFDDYLLTNVYFKPPPLDRLIQQMSSDHKITREALEALFYVRREYLSKALDTIETQYGGLDRYAKQELGITEEEIEQLKEAYLEPV